MEKENKQGLKQVESKQTTKQSFWQSPRFPLYLCVGFSVFVISLSLVGAVLKQKKAPDSGNGGDNPFGIGESCSSDSDCGLVDKTLDCSVCGGCLVPDYNDYFAVNAQAYEDYYASWLQKNCPDFYECWKANFELEKCKPIVCPACEEISTFTYEPKCIDGKCTKKIKTSLDYCDSLYIASDKFESLVSSQMLDKEQTDLMQLYLYVEDKLDDSQRQILKQAEIAVDEKHYTPPVGSHPLGFYPARCPVKNLCLLADLDFIKKVRSAEKEIVPQDQAESVSISTDKSSYKLGEPVKFTVFNNTEDTVYYRYGGCGWPQIYKINGNEEQGVVTDRTEEAPGVKSIKPGKKVECIWDQYAWYDPEREGNDRFAHFVSNLLVPEGIYQFKFWYWENKDDADKSRHEKQKTIVSERFEINDQTSIGDWKTYKKIEHGFKVEYPKEWEISEDEGNKEVIFSFHDKNQQKMVACPGCFAEYPLYEMGIRISNLSGESLEAFIREKRKLNPEELDKITISGKTGYRYEGFSNASSPSPIVLTIHNNKLFELWYLAQFNGEKFVVLFEHMLGSFEFLGSSLPVSHSKKLEKMIKKASQKYFPGIKLINETNDFYLGCKTIGCAQSVYPHNIAGQATEIIYLAYISCPREISTLSIDKFKDRISGVRELSFQEETELTKIGSRDIYHTYYLGESPEDYLKGKLKYEEYIFKSGNYFLRFLYTDQGTVENIGFDEFEDFAKEIIEKI